MRDHIEPMSKVEVLAAIRERARAMAEAEALAEGSEGAGSIEVQEAEIAYDEAAARLLVLIGTAEEIGLMAELQGFLTATYGG